MIVSLTCEPAVGEVIFEVGGELSTVTFCCALELFPTRRRLTEGMPPASLADTCTVTEPPTVAPEAGEVIDTDGTGLATMTWAVAEVALPARSWPVTTRVWEPFA